jgi:hypothetical protein
MSSRLAKCTLLGMQTSSHSCKHGLQQASFISCLDNLYIYVCVVFIHPNALVDLGGSPRYLCITFVLSALPEAQG